jgi:hypothetical protein
MKKMLIGMCTVRHLVHLLHRHVYSRHWQNLQYAYLHSQGSFIA